MTSIPSSKEGNQHPWLWKLISSRAVWKAIDIPDSVDSDFIHKPLTFIIMPLICQTEMLLYKLCMVLCYVNIVSAVIVQLHSNSSICWRKFGYCSCGRLWSLHQTSERVYWQRVSIACYAERCLSHDRFCPSDLPSQSGIMPKRLQLRSCGLHWRIAPWL